MMDITTPDGSITYYNVMDMKINQDEEVIIKHKEDTEDAEVTEEKITEPWTLLKVQSQRLHSLRVSFPDIPDSNDRTEVENLEVHKHARLVLRYSNHKSHIKHEDYNSVSVVPEAIE